MKKILQLAWAVLIVGVLVFGAGVPAWAQGSHAPLEDTYTDINNQTTPPGLPTSLVLAAANNGVTCTETTYWWFKFQVPATTSTISDATFSLVLSGGGNTQSLATELRSSANTSWSEDTLTWATQPALEVDGLGNPLVLATSPSVPRNGTITYSGSTFASYLNSHRGQTVSLVVRADCDGAIGLGASRAMWSKEYDGVSDATIIMKDPTAVELVSLNITTRPSSTPVLILVAALVALPTLAWVGKRLIRRRDQ